MEHFTQGLRARQAGEAHRPVEPTGAHPPQGSASDSSPTHDDQAASQPTNAAPRRLLDRVRDAIRLRHYSLRTEDAYVHWVRRFILFHDKRHPQDMGAAEVQAFLRTSR